MAALPLPDLRPPPKRTHTDTWPSLHAPRLLVVEDDVQLMPLLGRALHWVDPDVVLDWATDVGQARSAIVENEYRAILADFMLADSDSGLSIYADCRALQPEARFAMMSALPISLPVVAVGLLYKPFDLGRVCDFLRRLLDPSD